MLHSLVRHLYSKYSMGRARLHGPRHLGLRGQRRRARLPHGRVSSPAYTQCEEQRQVKQLLASQVTEGACNCHGRANSKQ